METVKNTGSTDLAEVRNWCYSIYGATGWTVLVANHYLSVIEWPYLVIINDPALLTEANEIWFNLKWSQQTTN